MQITFYPHGSNSAAGTTCLCRPYSSLVAQLRAEICGFTSPTTDWHLAFFGLLFDLCGLLPVFDLCQFLLCLDSLPFATCQVAMEKELDITLMLVKVAVRTSKPS